MFKYFEENYKYFFIIFLILFGVYFHIFFGGNFFNSHELDIYVSYDYLAKSNLEGWRLDKIIGTNMHIGDSSYNPWSILNLIYNLSIENKLLIHNILFLIFSFYSALAIYYFINFVNPELNKLITSLISSLIFISVLRLEFNYVFSWLLVYPTIIFTCIILFKFFETNNKKYIFLLFLNYFIGFNFGSIFAIQQSIFFSFIFFLFYSWYFKKNIFIPYIKIIFLSLLFLLFSSFWIFFPYIFENLVSHEEFIRTADYKRNNLYEFDLSLFKLFYNTFLGPFLNTGHISFPDKNIMPSYHWNNSLSVFFNLIFIYYLFLDKSKNFWIFLCKYIILFYLLHILLSEVSPLYYSANLYFFNTMSWSKVNIEMYIFQLLLLSFFIKQNFKVLNNLLIKFYFWILVFYISTLFLFSIDILFNINFVENFALLINKYNFFNFLMLFGINFENDALKLLIPDVFERIKYIVNYKFFFIHLTSLALMIILYFRQKKSFSIYVNLFFVLIIILNNFFSASYFTPLEKNNTYLWKDILKDEVIKDDERLIALTQNYLFNLKNEKVNYSNLTIKEVEDWIKRNPIKKINKHYGIMSPPYLSFSSNSSFMSKKLMEESRDIFKQVPQKTKFGFTSDKSFEILQEGIYNSNFINNLSIKYAYSSFDINKIGIFNNQLEYFWNDDNLYIYKIKDFLPYFYISNKILEIKDKFIDTKINSNEVYLFKNDYINYQNLNTGPNNFDAEIINNSSFKINYNSKFENILVISNLYDINWKIDSDKDIKLIKVNYFFTGVILKPGNYKIRIYFDNSKYKAGIYISLLSIFFIFLIYFRNYFNLRR